MTSITPGPDLGSSYTLMTFPQAAPVTFFGPGAEVTIVNGNAWWPLGDCHTRLPFQLLSDTGSSLDLTGSTICLWMRINEKDTVYKRLTGIAFIVDYITGEFTWKFSSEDVAVPGVYKMIVSAVYTFDTWNSYEQDFVIAGLAS